MSVPPFVFWALLGVGEYVPYVTVLDACVFYARRTSMSGLKNSP